MTITRRNALAGLGATLGAASIPGLPLSAPAGPIDLGRYFIPYWGQPIWSDAFYWRDFWPTLNAYRWQYDDQTYDIPLISCVENGRLFQVIQIGREPGAKVGVFEIWSDGHRIPGTPDRYFKPLAGAARFAAACALEIMPQRRKAHSGAVYIAFDDVGRPITTDAPPLIIHNSLSLSVWANYGDDDDEEIEESEQAEGLDIEDDNSA